uniref:uncharacterized protein LOC122593099 n=1 Tax=Erigeron canadensis TaxID=72917 RepID=UPI001CB977D4|nr:uncharacterized protein LOC122593099 [Erigeron canadensis]
MDVLKNGWMATMNLVQMMYVLMIAFNWFFFPALMTEIKSTWATLIWSTNFQLNTEIMQNALFSASETTKYCGCSTLRSLLDGFGVRVIYNWVLKFRSQRFNF